MKPFDLEAAKRGERVWIRSDKHNSWYEHAEFIGVTKTGRPIIEWPDGEVRSISNADERLCMAPKKQIVWVTLFEDGDAAWVDEPVHVSKGCVRTLAGCIPVEIEV